MSERLMKGSEAVKGLLHTEPLIFEHGSRGRNGASLPKAGVPDYAPADELGALARPEIDGMPEMSEPEVMRHYVRISQWNHGIDLGFYPLGSCTMKYNPKVNEAMARLPGFARLHPYMPEDMAQGAIRLMYELQEMLSEIAGFAQTTLQPAAGAHGELAGLMMIRAYHVAHGNPRKKVLVAETAHGTNPASSALCGYQVVPIKIGPEGYLHPEDVAKLMDEDVACIMATNPNTLGIFERHQAEISRIVHAKGGLVYGDGANMNAILGRTRPGDLGVDVMQYNLHKTFTTPHGGGGPGCGATGVSEKLLPYLPVPLAVKKGDTYSLEFDRPQSIGRLRTFWGNFGMFVRAYTYIRELGAEGLKDVSGYAVLNANYVRALLDGAYHLPYKTDSLHEVVFSDREQKKAGVSVMDVAKRIIDHGMHPPTVAFPLVVPGALMVEPTETESKETLDQFAAVMKEIAEEAKTNPEVLRNAPTVTHVSRMDETRAARFPVLRWTPGMDLEKLQTEAKEEPKRAANGR
jgi:glycine dehydrogenase subunit 2